MIAVGNNFLLHFTEVQRKVIGEYNRSTVIGEYVSMMSWH